MNVDDLTVRAKLEDDLSGPLDRPRKKIKEVGDEVDRTNRKTDEAERSTSRWASSLDRANRSGAGLLRTVGGAGARALGYFTTGLGIAAGAAVALGVKTAAAMENARIGFTTMLGSAKAADAFLRDLERFAATTPFEFPELQTAASSLISVGVEADKVIPIMTTLGDVTSGMGTGAEGVKRATVAIQQMIAANKVQAQDLNQLRDAGIPVYDLLAGATGKSKEELSALVQEGKLGAPVLKQLMTALETGKGLERFDGLMEKQSRSLGGRWSTLSDTVTMGLARAFRPAIPVLKDLLVVADTGARKVLPIFESGLKRTVQLGRDLYDAYGEGGVGAVRGVIEDAFGGQAAAVFDKAVEMGQDLATVWSDLLKPAIDDLTGAVPALVSPLTLLDDVLGFLADNGETLAPILTALVAGTLAYKAAMTGATAVMTVVGAAQRIYAAGLVTTAAAGGAAATTQWSLNAALTANPVGLVVVAIAALVAGLVLAYKKSETFRSAVDWLWNKGLKPFGNWLKEVLPPIIKEIAKVALFMIEWWIRGWGMLAKAAFAAFDLILAAAEKGLGWVPGLGDKIKGAREAFDEFGEKVTGAMDAVADKLRGVREGLDDLAKPRSTTFTIHTVRTGATEGGLGPQPFIGDTNTSRYHGGGGSAWAGHMDVNARLGGRYSVSNALIGGGGMGHGSGDHQKGRALDVVGPNLDAYAREIRRDGGYAAIHGTGRGKHVHAVPAGDTNTPRAVGRRRGGTEGTTVVFSEGSVQVIVGAGADAGMVKAAVKQGIAEAMRDAEELDD